MKIEMMVKVNDDQFSKAVRALKNKYSVAMLEEDIAIYSECNKEDVIKILDSANVQGYKISE